MLSVVVERVLNLHRVKPKLKASVQEARWSFQRTAVWVKLTAILRFAARCDLPPVWEKHFATRVSPDAICLQVGLREAKSPLDSA